ncbi:hypothetical protein Y032_0096g2954 [Ancylostoma ceylanicum]|uniref:Uncharacterized protein n=1 Tax=Ancylostoma ceylanicum TaxID=53326 RepID=A0A016TKF6_9BILA|nr:hypothetical protein Y032_0096g2954 [Ancylostoma ceylanicum]
MRIDFSPTTVSTAAATRRPRSIRIKTSVATATITSITSLLENYRAIYTRCLTLTRVRLYHKGCRRSRDPSLALVSIIHPPTNLKDYLDLYEAFEINV